MTLIFTENCLQHEAVIWFWLKRGRLFLRWKVWLWQKSHNKNVLIWLLGKKQHFKTTNGKKWRKLTFTRWLIIKKANRLKKVSILAKIAAKIAPINSVLSAHHLNPAAHFSFVPAAKTQKLQLHGERWVSYQLSQQHLGKYMHICMLTVIVAICSSSANSTLDFYSVVLSHWIKMIEAT